MESLQSIKSRIKAVRNIGQITKAMEVVAATKMRKSQQIALDSRPYAFKALQLLSVLSKYSPIKSRLMGVKKIKSTLLIIMTSDRGLAGSFNSQVIKTADKFIEEYSEKGKAVLNVAVVGKKAMAYASKRGIKPDFQFSGFGDYIKPSETDSLADLIIKGFLDKRWGKVVTISTHFRTTLKQEVLKREILPINLNNIQDSITEIIPKQGRFSELLDSSYKLQDTGFIDYIFEPVPEKIIEQLVDHLVRMEIYHLVLEANASEHSARMVAMKTASDNAKELSENLNLEYNKARQAGITKELIEITSAINTLQ